jgi:YhcH/YjgK/YiaL family protein
MILDCLAEAARYASLHPGFAQAFRFLSESNLVLHEPGKHELDGQRLFVILSYDPGRGRARAKLEAHRQYIDIQYVVRGTDEMGWAPLSNCAQLETPYDAQRDVAFYADVPEVWLPVAAGQFVVFWPEDAHAPLAGEGELIKAVVKIALDR